MCATTAPVAEFIATVLTVSVTPGPTVHAAPAYTSQCCRIRGAISSRLASVIASGGEHLEISAVFVALAPDPVPEYTSCFLQCPRRPFQQFTQRQRQWQGTLREARLVRGASCSRTCSISAHGRVQILYVVRFLPETLRRHPLICCCELQGRCGATFFYLLLRAAETLRRHCRKLQLRQRRGAEQVRSVKRFGLVRRYWSLKRRGDQVRVTSHS